MAVTPLPALDRTSATFKVDVDAFFASSLPTFSVQVEAARVEVNAKESAASDAASTANTKAGEAATSAIAASDKAAEAATSAGAAEASRIAASKLNLGSKSAEPSLDNQGAALTAGATYYDTTLSKWRVWTGSTWGDGISSIAGVSSVNGQSGPVAIKTVNGTSLLGSGNVDTGDVTLSGVQTLANKTLNSPVFNDGYTEEVFAVTGTAPALSPTNGSIQTWPLTGNATPTAGTWASGQSMTLMVDDGSAYTINWASMPVTWKTGGGTAPTLLASGYTVIELVKVGSTIYGWLAGDA